MKHEETRPESRVDRKKEATKQKILAAAAELFRQRGFDLTTMELIADEADIAKGTLYSYYPVKEAILADYVQRSLQDQHASRSEQLRQLPDTRSRLTQLLTDLMERVQGQRELFEKYLAYSIQRVVSLRPLPGPGAKNEYGRLVIEIIERGQADGEIRTDLPREMLVDLFDFVLVEVAKPLYTAPDTFDVDASITQGVDLFIRAVRPGS